MNFWTYNSVRLEKFGVVTILDDILSMPTRRGDNVSLPYSDGSLWVRKFYDQQIISLGIFIHAPDLFLFDVILDDMKALFGTGTLKTLSNSWPTIQGNDGVRQAQAEVIGTLDVVRDVDDPLCANVVVTFRLPQPFLRSVSAYALNTTINASPKTFTFTNPGTAEERKAILTLTGPLSSPKVENLSLTPNVWFQYTGVIAAGHYVTIDCYNFTALYDGVTNHIDKISHGGDVVPMTFLSGANSMRVTDGTHTTGVVGISSYPPFL